MVRRNHQQNRAKVAVALTRRVTLECRERLFVPRRNVRLASAFIIGPQIPRIRVRPVRQQPLRLRRVVSVNCSDKLPVQPHVPMQGRHAGENASCHHKQTAETEKPDLQARPLSLRGLCRFSRRVSSNNAALPQGFDRCRRPVVFRHIGKWPAARSGARHCDLRQGLIEPGLDLGRAGRQAYEKQ